MQKNTVALQEFWRGHIASVDSLSGGIAVRQYLRLVRLPAKVRRRAMLRMATRGFAKDQRGGEILEYSLVAGLIVIGAIGVIACVGTKVVARWNRVSSSLG